MRKKEEKITREDSNEEGDKIEDDKNYEVKIQKYSILLSVAQDLFNRLDNSINQLQSRIAILIGNLLATFSIVGMFIIYLLQNGWRPSCLESSFLVAFSILMLASFFIAFKNFLPQTYYEIEIFEKERLDELCKMPLLDMYSDTIYWLKKNYKDNFTKYEDVIDKIKLSAILFLIAVLFVIGVLIAEVIL